MSDEKGIIDSQTVAKGQWVILELFGHKVISGFMSRDESLGAPLIRMDIPATSNYPAFTRHYHPNAIYSVSYVSEETARITAEAIEENPVSVYVPDLGDLARLQKENEQMVDVIVNLQRSLNR
jgi:hypothetical protein